MPFRFTGKVQRRAVQLTSDERQFIEHAQAKAND
jgi:hypothetical protein